MIKQVHITSSINSFIWPHEIWYTVVSFDITYYDRISGLRSLEGMLQLRSRDKRGRFQNEVRLSLFNHIFITLRLLGLSVKLFFSIFLLEVIWSSLQIVFPYFFYTTTLLRLHLIGITPNLLWLLLKFFTPSSSL